MMLPESHFYVVNFVCSVKKWQDHNRLGRRGCTCPSMEEGAPGTSYLMTGEAAGHIHGVVSYTSHYLTHIRTAILRISNINIISLSLRRASGIHHDHARFKTGLALHCSPRAHGTSMQRSLVSRYSAHSFTDRHMLNAWKVWCLSTSSRMPQAKRCAPFLQLALAESDNEFTGYSDTENTSAPRSSSPGSASEGTRPMQ